LKFKFRVERVLGLRSSIWGSAFAILGFTFRVWGMESGILDYGFSVRLNS